MPGSEEKTAIAKLTAENQRLEELLKQLYRENERLRAIQNQSNQDWMDLRKENNELRNKAR